MSESEEKRKQEEKKPAEESEKPKEQVYVPKGIPVHAYLTDTGEFRWIPVFEACCDREKAKEIVEVLKKIPADRRAVWAQRLDLDEAKITCPVISKEVDLCKDFDDLCAAYSRPVGTRPDEKHKGGESSNERI